MENNKSEITKVNKTIRLLIKEGNFNRKFYIQVDEVHKSWLFSMIQGR